MRYSKYISVKYVSILLTVVILPKGSISRLLTLSGLLTISALLIASGQAIKPELVSLIKYVRPFPVRDFSHDISPDRSSFFTILEQRLLSMPSSLLSSD
jgi:hypothetical protein